MQSVRGLTRGNKMIVNPGLMKQARDNRAKEQRKISDLTVSEFRAIMQKCFDAERRKANAIEQERKAKQLYSAYS